jgi:hypothetical protein
MTNPVLVDFNSKMVTMMTVALRELPFDDLVDVHNDLVDEYEETAGSNQEAAVVFALRTVAAVIREKQVSRALN